MFYLHHRLSRVHGLRDKYKYTTWTVNSQTLVVCLVQFDKLKEGCDPLMILVYFLLNYELTKILALIVLHEIKVEW